MGAFVWGAPTSTGLGDIAVPANYDRNGTADIAVYRAATGQWFVLRPSNGTFLQLNWGATSLGDLIPISDGGVLVAERGRLLWREYQPRRECAGGSDHCSARCFRTSECDDIL